MKYLSLLPIIVLLAVSIQAQTAPEYYAAAKNTISDSLPEFLGDRDPSAVAITPRHRITVWTGGYDQRHPKWAKGKTYNRCMANGLPENSCIAAQEYVRKLTGQDAPSILLDEIDNAADNIIQVWNGCGGNYASFINRFNWSSVTVTVRETAFPNPDTGVISGGVTTDSGHSVWVVDLFFQGWFSDRAHASLATMGEFANWEMGNATWRAFAGSYKDIGDGSPCLR